MLAELIRKNRTVRRFREQRELEMEQLLALLDLARLGGSARNLQPLKYLIAAKPEQRKLIFPHLGWAGYLSDWPGPDPGERPTAYIVCLLDRNLVPSSISDAAIDLGIATQNILLGAAEQGISGCRIGSFSSKLHADLNFVESLEIMLVLALGYLAERVVLENVESDGIVHYWRDENLVHHVPKRALQDILV